MYKADIIKRYKQFNNFGREQNMDFKLLSPGEIEYYFKVQEKHLATPNVVHGGAIAGFMDATLAVAGLSYTLEDNNVVSTVEFKINYLKPAFLGEELIGRGKLISAGKRILFVEADIITQRDGENIIIATGSGTLNAYPASKAMLA
ncbi:MAG: PaaI family thioesterase [Lishizhenia sp.]